MSPHDDRTDRLSLPQAADEACPVLDAGSRLGRYRIEGLIGRGGMGTVYHAEQVEPVRRPVAIKLSRERRLGAEELARFAVERQILAHMNHPAIAALFDAGTLDDGRPFFVMERVEGSQLGDYLRRHRLSLEQRVGLLRAVCLGVDHAHRRGIIHCDLKPSNILVVEIDGGPQPKIIDFGIARALVHGLTDNGSSGTPGYMSPEQTADAGDLDTRTDVYSLGVIAYEVLSGRRLGDAESASPPVRLPLIDTAARGEAAAGRLGELDALLGRTMAAGREQRPDSALALAEEFARWLQRRPLASVGDRPGYRLRCLVRRHGVLVGLGALASLLVLLLAWQLLEQFAEVRRQRDRAEQSVRMLLDTFAAADPYSFPGGSMTVRDLLQRSAQRLREVELDREVLRRLLETLGDVQQKIELYEDADRTLEAAERLADGVAADRLRLARVRVWLHAERYAEADTALQALQARATAGGDRALAFEVALLLGELYQYTDRFDEAERLLFARESEAAAQSDELRFGWLRMAGRLRLEQQRIAEALPRLREAWRLASDQWGAADPRTTGTLNDLAVAESRGGNPAVAETLQRQVAAHTEHSFGGDSVALAIDLDNLAVMLQKQDDPARLDEAIALHRWALGIFRSRLGSASTHTASAANSLASALERAGHLATAEQHYAEAETAMRAALGDAHSMTAVVRHNRARCLLALGQTASARPLLERSGAALQASLGDRHPRYAVWQSTWAALLIQEGDREAAAAMLAQALPVLRSGFGAQSREVQRAETLAAQVAKGDG